MPPFYALDLRVDKTYTFKRWWLETYIDLLNVVREAETPRRLTTTTTTPSPRSSVACPSSRPSDSARSMHFDLDPSTDVRM